MHEYYLVFYGEKSHPSGQCKPFTCVFHLPPASSAPAHKLRLLILSCT